jgi:hypothetical protein
MLFLSPCCQSIEILLLQERDADLPALLLMHIRATNGLHYKVAY